MTGPDQFIKTILIPEHGLELSPEFIEQCTVSPNFSRVFSYLIAKAPDRGILIRATTDGSLKVVSAGTPFEHYIVFSGIGNDNFIAANTKTYTQAYNVTDIFVETHPSIISFRNHQGTWLDEKKLPVGYHSIDFIHYGYKIRNRTLGSNTVFETTIYRAL